jgi:hypothetical protein
LGSWDVVWCGSCEPGSRTGPKELSAYFFLFLASKILQVFKYPYNDSNKDKAGPVNIPKEDPNTDIESKRNNSAK